MTHRTPNSSLTTFELPYLVSFPFYAIRICPTFHKFYSLVSTKEKCLRLVVVMETMKYTCVPPWMMWYAFVLSFISIRVTILLINSFVKKHCLVVIYKHFCCYNSVD